MAVAGVAPHLLGRLGRLGRLARLVVTALGGSRGSLHTKPEDRRVINIRGPVLSGRHKTCCHCALLPELDVSPGLLRTVLRSALSWHPIHNVSRVSTVRPGGAAQRGDQESPQPVLRPPVSNLETSQPPAPCRQALALLQYSARTEDSTVVTSSHRICTLVKLPSALGFAPHPWALCLLVAKAPLRRIHTPLASD